MSAPTMTLAQVRGLEPCSTRINALENLLPSDKEITMAEARACGATFDDLVWLVSVAAKKNKDVERRLRLWLADCAMRVLHIFEKDYPQDRRPRNAIIAARKYARGEIGAAARAAAWDAARDAARDAAWAAARDAAWDAARAAARDAAWAAARDAAWDAARAAARDAAWDAARAAARAAARDAAWDAARAAARAAARDAEQTWQFNRLVEWFSDNEPQEVSLRSK